MATHNTQFVLPGTKLFVSRRALCRTYAPFFPVAVVATILGDNNNCSVIFGINPFEDCVPVSGADCLILKPNMCLYAVQ